MMNLNIVCLISSFLTWSNNININNNEVSLSGAFHGTQVTLYHTRSVIKHTSGGGPVLYVDG